MGSGRRIGCWGRGTPRRVSVPARQVLLAVSALLLALAGHRGAAALDVEGVDVVVRVVDEQQLPLADVSVVLWWVADEVTEVVPDDRVWAASADSDATGQAVVRLRQETSQPGRFAVDAAGGCSDDPVDLLRSQHVVDLTGNGIRRSEVLEVDASGALVVPVRALNLEVVLETVDGQPGLLGSFEVEERAAGGGPGDWAPTEHLADRFARSVTSAWPMPEPPDRVLARIDRCRTPPASSASSPRSKTAHSSGSPSRWPGTGPSRC